MKFFPIFIIFTLLILSVVDSVACAQKDLNYNQNNNTSFASPLKSLEAQLTDDFSNDHCDVCPNSCFLNLVYSQKKQSNYQTFAVNNEEPFFINDSLLVSNFNSKNERPPILV